MYYEEASDPSFWQYYAVMLVVSTIVSCLLLNTMATLTERISPDLRTLSPAQVWVSVIPVFGSFWIFHVVNQLSNMLREEFARRKIVEFETSPGLSSGLGFCFTVFVAQLTLILDSPALSIFLYIAAIALLALYWSKLAGFRQKLDADLYQSQQSWQSPEQQQQQWPPQQFPPPQFPPPPQQYNTPPQWNYPPPPQDFPPQAPPPPDEWEKWRPK